MDGINVLFDVLTALVGLLAEGAYQIDVEALAGMGKHTGPILCLFATSFACVVKPGNESPWFFRIFLLHTLTRVPSLQGYQIQ